MYKKNYNPVCVMFLLLLSISSESILMIIQHCNAKKHLNAHVRQCIPLRPSALGIFRFENGSLHLENMLKDKIKQSAASNVKVMSVHNDNGLTTQQSHNETRDSDVTRALLYIYIYI